MTELLYKSLASYKERYANPELAQMRFTFYEQKRKDLIAVLREKRIHQAQNQSRMASRMNATASSSRGMSQAGMRKTNNLLEVSQSVFLFRVDKS